MSLYSTWNIDEVKSHVDTFSAHPAQWKVDGKAVVSTFEGPEVADQWSFIDASSTLFAPDWTSAKGNSALFQAPSVGG
jgi:hypothetical protein